MDALMEWWRSMPRSRQLVAAVAAFWLVYLCAAVFDWMVAGPADAASRLAAAAGMQWVVDDAAAASLTAPALSGGLTMGDLVVLVAAAFIIASLATIGIFAWRETHGAGRDAGMAAGDDPLWSGPELDLAFFRPDRI